VQPSSWLNVASVSPASNARAHARTTDTATDPATRGVLHLGQSVRVEFSATHISEEMNSRLRRAFSKAPLSERRWSWVVGVIDDVLEHLLGRHRLIGVDVDPKIE